MNESTNTITLRCGFCLALNTVELGSSMDQPICGDCSKPILLDRPVKVTQEDFDRTVLGSGVPVLVDFYADWCAPCKMVAPLLDEIANREVGKMLVVKLDTDHAPDVAMKYEIRSISEGYGSRRSRIIFFARRVGPYTCTGISASHSFS